MKTDDITVLIQGPINQTSLDNIENYLKFGRVLVKYWENDEKENLLFSHELTNQFDKEKAKQNPEEFHGTFRWQVDGAYFGLKKVKTKYAIRTRSDESFSDLRPLIDIFKENPNKIVCGNIFWRDSDVGGLGNHKHIGDHILMGPTETLLKGYELIKEMHDKREFPRGWGFLSGEHSENPENGLYANCLKAFKLLNPDVKITNILDVFDFINVIKLGNYKISRSHPEPGHWTNQNPMAEDFKSALSLIEERCQLEGRAI